MLGPLGCGLQTGAGAVLNVMQPAAGQSIAVYGVGGVGLAGLMAATDRRLRSDHRRRSTSGRLALGARTRCHVYARKPRRGDARRNPQDHRRRTDFALETSASGRVPARSRRAARPRHLHPGRQCRAGTEVSFEMPWLQGGRLSRCDPGRQSAAGLDPRLVDLFMAGRMPSTTSSRVHLPRSTALPPIPPRALRSSQCCFYRTDPAPPSLNRSKEQDVQISLVRETGLPNCCDTRPVGRKRSLVV